MTRTQQHVVRYTSGEGEPWYSPDVAAIEAALFLWCSTGRVKVSPKAPRRDPSSSCGEQSAAAESGGLAVPPPAHGRSPRSGTSGGPRAHSGSRTFGSNTTPDLTPAEDSPARPSALNEQSAQLPWWKKKLDREKNNKAAGS